MNVPGSIDSAGGLVERAVGIAEGDVDGGTTALHVQGAVDVLQVLAHGRGRHYDRASLLNRDTKNARIWLGLHFRRAMDDGNLIGRESADNVYGHHLRRVS